MSHYGVLVVGGNVEEQMAPYHEFECTGKDDQYVQEIDTTEDSRKEYLSHTTRQYRDPEGNIVSPFTKDGNWDKRFWRELTPEEKAKFPGEFYQDYDEKEHGVRLYSCDWHDGQRYHTKIFQFPSEGWSEVEVPNSTVETFAEWCEHWNGHKVVPFGTEPDIADEHKYGYTIVDEKGDVVRTIDRTNPNKKWDWFQVGGRWNGFFKLKPMAVGVVGEPGLQKMNSDYEHPGEDRADVLMKGDIDVEGMRDEEGEKAGERYDLFRKVTLAYPTPLSWSQVQAKHQKTGMDADGELAPLVDGDGEPLVDWEAAREEYNSQPAVKALRENRDTTWFELEKFQCSREEYVQRARNEALTVFAYVKDGVWHERGRMGWWATVSDAMDRNEWIRQFNEMLDALPDNTLLTVVDCHI